MLDKTTLPKNWKIACFFELLDYIQPTNYIVESTEYNDNYKTPVLTAGKSFIIGYTNEKEGIFNSLPVIIFDDFTTATQFVNFPFKVKSSAMKILHPKDELVNIKFVFYYMQTVRIKSETHKRYWISEYSKLPIPLPTLSEQQQVVSKIEKLFSELDKGKQQLETVRQQLKTYRQSVLKWAFEGKFTSVNESTAGTSRDLSRSTDNLKSLPEGWKWVSLDDLCDSKRKCSYGVLVPGEHDENGIRLIRVGDIDDTGRIANVNLKKISPVIARKFKRTFLEGDEIVISLVGAIGRTAVVPISLKGANIARAVGVIPISKDISSKFVEMMLRSPSKIKEHNEKAHEVARKTLNLEDVKKSKIPLPPREVQENIVLEIETRLSGCDKMEETIENSLRQVESLRQSILKQAFEGKLV